MLHGQKFTSGTFQAVAWKYGIKSKSNFCWKSSKGELVKYSHDAVAFIKRLTSGDIDLAKHEYRERTRKRDTIPATATLPLTAGQEQAAS